MTILERYNAVMRVECEVLSDFENDIKRKVWECKVRYMKETLDGKTKTHDKTLVNMVDIRDMKQVMLNNNVAYFYFGDNVSCVVVKNDIGQRYLECGYDE